MFLTAWHLLADWFECSFVWIKFYITLYKLSGLTSLTFLYLIVWYLILSSLYLILYTSSVRTTTIIILIKCYAHFIFSRVFITRCHCVCYSLYGFMDILTLIYVLIRHKGVGTYYGNVWRLSNIFYRFLTFLWVFFVFVWNVVGLCSYKELSANEEQCL